MNRVIERVYEDNDEKHALRKCRAENIAVDSSWIYEQARQNYPVRPLPIIN